MSRAAIGDLFDIVPADNLTPVLREVDCAQPFAAIWARMKQANGGFGLAGTSASRLIFGFGVEGRGSSWEECAAEWVRAARQKLGPG